MKISKHNIIVLSTALAVSVFIFQIKQKNRDGFTSKIFRSGTSGWGYDILVNNKLFIRQESIPVYSGSKGFPEKEQAEKTASLIINKMKRGQPPVITTFEIQQICPANEPGHAIQRKIQ